jgi:hypothetical protein
MHIRINKRRVRLDPTSSEEEIFRVINNKLSWPKSRAYFEWEDNHVVEIRNDHELRLACRILSESMYNEVRDWAKDTAMIESKIATHMAEPDSETDEEMHSEDDMTMEDFYMMGFRHEIFN